MRRDGQYRLGELERAVMERLWVEGESDVRAMHEALSPARGISFNTVQSTLERLHRKGLAQRDRIGRAHRYRARFSRQEWMTGALESVSSSFPAAPPECLLQAFVDLADRAGAEQLAELERLVRERRRRGRPEGSSS